VIIFSVENLCILCRWQTERRGLKQTIPTCYRAPYIGHENDVMSGRSFRGDCVACTTRSVSPASRAYLLASPRFGEIENRRLEMRVCRAECERVGAASAACVEEALAVANRNPLRHQSRGPKRTGVLSRREL
jgi:hypothetical protein